MPTQPMSDRRFDIPSRPERVYPAAGGLRYEGGSHFVLEPREDCDLQRAVTATLADDRYVAGDWFDLPQPVFLVHDGELDTTFKVVVAAESVRLHVLPETDSAALAAFFESLRGVSDVEWTVGVSENDRG